MMDEDLSESGADVAHDASEQAVTEPSPQPAESPYREPPQSWQRDIADRHWNALPDDLRGYLHTREKEAGGKISELGHRASELEGPSTRYQSMQGVFDRYRSHIPEGLEPEQAFETLLNVQQMISTPETREQAFAQLLQSCGVNPLALLPPQYREQIETAQRELQKVRETEVQRTLDEFTKGKDYYPEIRDEVIKEIVAIRKGAPGLDNATVLKLAHDRVVDRTGINKRLELERSAKEFEENRKRMEEQAKVAREAEAKRVKEAKRAASINVKSSPASPGPRTLEDDLRAIARRAYG